MLFPILAPNIYAFQPKQTASLYLVYPGIRFSLCLETPNASLSVSLKIDLQQVWVFFYVLCLLLYNIVIYIVIKYILVFVNIVVHPIVDARFCYFIFLGKDRLIFISDVNRIISPVVVFVTDIIASLRFNRLPGIITIFQILFM